MTQRPEERPARVAVRSPHTSRVPRRRTPAAEIDEQTAVGEVYVRSLLRSQLRLAVGVVALVGLVVGTLPLLFAEVAAVREAHVLGVPLPWLLLGFLVYPFLLVVAVAYSRRAERNEADFARLLEEEER